MRRLIGVFLLLVSVGLLLALIVLYNKMEVEQPSSSNDSDIAVRELSEEELSNQEFLEQEVDIYSGEFEVLTRTNFASGKANLKEDRIELSEDFYVSQSCPNIMVGLTNEDNVSLDWQRSESNFVEVSELSSFSGNQIYDISNQVPDGFNQALILWCQDYNYLVSFAKLKQAP